MLKLLQRMVMINRYDNNDTCLKAIPRIDMKTTVMKIIW